VVVVVTGGGNVRGSIVRCWGFYKAFRIINPLVLLFLVENHSCVSFLGNQGQVVKEEGA